MAGAVALVRLVTLFWSFCISLVRRVALAVLAVLAERFGHLIFFS